VWLAARSLSSLLDMQSEGIIGYFVMIVNSVPIREDADMTDIH